MAATVVDATTSDFVTRQHFGAVPFDKTVTIATTSIDEAGDDVLLFQFPEGAMLPGFWLPVQVTPSDMDTHATPTLVLDFGIADSDGVIDTVLINDSTGGQTGTIDYTDSGVADWIDVGGKYFGMTVVTAAATAAAGTVGIAGVYFINHRALTA